MACEKCLAETVEGFIPDQAYGAIARASFVDGQPEKSLWRGIKLDPKKMRPIAATRCTKCGRIELFAKP